MANPFRSDLSNGIGLLAARLPLGAAFILSGFAKFQLSGGVSEYVYSMLPRVPDYVPADAADKFLMAVPYAQLGLGVLVLAGLLTRVSAFGTALLSVAFGLMVGFIDTQANSTEWISQPTTYLGFSLVALFAGPGMFSVDRLLFARSAKSGD